MKRIEAQAQPRLGVGRCVQLAVSGMRYQLLRSLITVGTLALAVVFVVFMAGSAVLARDVQMEALQQVLPTRETQRWLARLRTAESERTVLSALERGERDRLTEYTAWLGGDASAAARVAEAQSGARELAGVRRWFAQLPEAASAALMQAGTVEGTLDRLGDASSWSAFVQRSGQLGLALPESQPGAFKSFVEAGWPALRESVRALGLAHAAAAGALGRVWDEGEVLPSLEAARAAGFVLDAELWERLKLAGSAQRDRAWVSRQLESSLVRGAVARALEVEPTRVNVSEVLLASGASGTAELVIKALRSGTQAGGDDQGVSIERLHELGRAERRMQRASSVLPAESATGDASALSASGATHDNDASTGLLGGLGAEAWLLLLLSLLVCVVGITNAMLMSVTERFTQIATMKCLGALDGTVRGVFVIEAMMLGLVGGAVGGAIGLVIVVLRGALRFGSLLWETTGTLGNVALVCGLAMLLGLVLAVVSAVGPAWAAARLAPMEAMRIE